MTKLLGRSWVGADVMNDAEREAQAALSRALQALEEAHRRSSDAGYGSEILTSLYSAAALADYALRVARAET